MSKREWTLVGLMALALLLMALAFWAVLQFPGPSQAFMDVQQTRQTGAGLTAVYEYRQTQDTR